MGKSMTKNSGYRHRLGNKGETVAVHFLKKKGYQILERNFRLERGEIDIIAKDGDTLVFVEVKTGISGKFGEPEERVDQKKQMQVGKVAMEYLQSKNLENVDCRFDVVAVSRVAGNAHIRHIEDAFWLDPNAAERLF